MTAALSSEQPGAGEPQAGSCRSVAEAYRTIRSASEHLCQPLAPEDHCIQGMPDVSPPKWHLAHTTWFFETFVLSVFLPRYRCFDARFAYLFNSYYESVGAFFPRSRRGLLSRPTVQEIYRYRAHVDAAMARLLADPNQEFTGEMISRIVLGLNHEQQHQELLLTDIKYNFALNPLRPVFREASSGPDTRSMPLRWAEFRGGVHAVGFTGEGFAYDNETPRHQAYLEDFRLASRPVTNGEFREFIDAGGYRRADLWLSDGWLAVKEYGWQAPLYWEKIDGGWWLMTLAGMRRLDEDEPVCHVSFYEADAFARWRGFRLPTEAEWEVAAEQVPIRGNFRESGLLQPVAATGRAALDQLFGDVWEWTCSAYAPYPGFRPLTGSLAEYNGKFMCNQFVLRGGSCVTPRSHMRRSYRNFFYPADRWQFSGIRLAADGR